MCMCYMHAGTVGRRGIGGVHDSGDDATVLLLL
jgi:hypothetical protein